MKTWDDVKYLYYNVAVRYKRYYPEFDIDELVNEAWIMSYPYINVEGYKIVHKIHRVIMTYIRSQTGVYYQKNLQKRKITINSYDSITEREGQEDNSDWIPSDKQHYFEAVDAQDYIESRADRLTKEDKILLYMRYELGLTTREICRLANRSYESIRLKIENALKIMKGVKFKEIENGKKNFYEPVRNDIGVWWVSTDTCSRANG